MSLVYWLLVVFASSTVVAVDVALTPCHSVFYLKDLKQEFKFDSSLSTAGTNLSDCVFTLLGPNYSSLKLLFHDVVEQDPVTGATMTEPFCIDGAVRIYEMTSDGDLYISDAVCRSLSSSTEVNTTYNVAVVTSTITSGKFNLTVTVVPGVIPTVPKVVEADDPDYDPTADDVFEDLTTTTLSSATDEDDNATEVDNDMDVDNNTMIASIDTSEKSILKNDTITLEEEIPVFENDELAVVGGNKSTKGERPSITGDSITVEATDLKGSGKKSKKVKTNSKQNAKNP